MTTFADRLATVLNRIQSAAIAAGREPSSVQLLAVSKLHSPEAIRDAYDAGLRHFGENYAQELADKAACLTELTDIRWHMIGHLQSNKARVAASVAHVVQSVDSARVAIELGKRAAAVGRTVAVLVEVKIADEHSKTGCMPSELPEVFAAIRAAPALALRGLMTIPPYTDDPDEARPYFAHLRALRDQHGGSAALPELSMGMSHDLEVAIAEGATMVRVGTALFGERHVHLANGT